MARRLISREMGEITSPSNSNGSTILSPAKMRPHLTALVGDGGFRALLGRALALAAAELPELRSVRVSAQGSLNGAEGLSARLSLNEFIEVRVALLAQLLGLLEAFIGEKLTLQLVREIWPQDSLYGFDLGNWAQNEKNN